MIGIPKAMQALVKMADDLFARARQARTSGDWDLAESLCDKGESIYARLENQLPKKESE